MDNPLVSIVIPTYNQESFILRALESAINQTYNNLEIIISDDCSTDFTSKKVLSYLNKRKTRKEVKYYRNKYKLGRVKNYRISLYERVKGDWVLMLDGDDYLYDKSVIEEAIDKLKYFKNPQVVAILGKQVVNDTINNIKWIQPRTLKDQIIDGLNVFLNWPSISFGHLSVLYKSGIAKKIGFYENDIISTDWESILKLLLTGKVLLINKIFGVWNLHDNNISQKSRLIKKLNNLSFIGRVKTYAQKQGINKFDITMWEIKMYKNQISTLIGDIIEIISPPIAKKIKKTFRKLAFKAE